DRLHGEVECHELDDRVEALESSADAEAREAIFGDRRVDHALGTKLLEEALADLVGTLIFRDLLAHQEHRRIAAHLLGHGVAPRFPHGHAHGIARDYRLGLGRRDGRRAWRAAFRLSWRRCRRLRCRGRRCRGLWRRWRLLLGALVVLADEERYRRI